MINLVQDSFRNARRSLVPPGFNGSLDQGPTVRQLASEFECRTSFHQGLCCYHGSTTSHRHRASVPRESNSARRQRRLRQRRLRRRSRSYSESLLRWSERPGSQCRLVSHLLTWHILVGNRCDARTWKLYETCTMGLVWMFHDVSRIGQKRIPRKSLVYPAAKKFATSWVTLAHPTWRRICTLL